jgi:hypothetical protein
MKIKSKAYIKLTAAHAEGTPRREHTKNRRSAQGVKEKIKPTSNPR